MQRETPMAEFSRPIAVDQISSEGTVREIDATPAERARLAERFGLLALDRLTASLRLQRRAGGIIQVKGHLDAEVVQSCVVTLDPVRARIADDFMASFGNLPVAESREVILDLGEDGLPEPIVGGRIDLGELVAQQLAVAIDPYPRSPSAAGVFPEAPEDDDGGTEPNKPFSALADWRPPRSEH